MRVVKEAEERRNEILDAADELFGLKGFDGTSTNDILEKVGIARGTLYYHFKSKEDIMDALIDRSCVNLLGTARKIAEDKTIPVNQRILRVVMSLNLSGKSSSEIIEHIHKPQNALMHQKTKKAVITGVPPILTDILREGIKEGLFNTPYPYECMEMLVVYAETVFDGDMVELTDAERTSRIQAFLFNIGRLLLVEGDNMKYFTMMFDSGNEGGNE
jgi:AcrR family transcriptional regulator